MYKLYILLLITVGFTVCSHAQSADSGITVHKNSRLDLLLKKQATEKATSSETHFNTVYKVRRQGYRVMVLNTNDRMLAYKTKGQMLSSYPNQQVYMSYKTPFFKLKMGNFIDKPEAESLRNELSKSIGKGVFTIRETIIVTIKPDEEVKM